MARSLAPLTVLLAACSDYGAMGDFSQTDAAGTYTTVDGDDDDGTTTPPPPPEEEEDLLRLPPAQTPVYVFVANPDRDTVSRVEVHSLAVDTTPVGHDPRIVVTTPDFRTAVVFNRGDETVSILDADTLAQEVVEVRDNLNDLVLSPDGRWAVLWHNEARVRPDDPVSPGLQSFNEASFVRIADASHQPLAVGFDPRMVRFTPDGHLAVVISDGYLALVDLTEETLRPRLVELQPGVLDPAQAQEVVIAPDGSYAWARLFGVADLLVVDLADGDVTSVPAGVDPSDLDLSPQGDLTVSVARTSRELFVFETDDPYAAPRVVPLPPDASYGSLQWEPGGGRAVLYTNASPEERFAVWTERTDEIVERGLVKPVERVAISPTGDTLVVFHTVTDGPITEPVFAGKPAITLVDLDDFRSNPLLLPGVPLAYADAASGERGYFVMEDQNWLEVLDYGTLLHRQVPLPSPPVFLGVLPDLRPGDLDEPQAWVSQEYPLGRLTFYEPDDDGAETLTGFELNSAIDTDGGAR